MRYIVERNDQGQWCVNVYNIETGQKGAEIICSSTRMAMKVFLMLAGDTSLEDERYEVVDENTQPSIKLEAV